MNGAVSISYTHLDVYNRQEYTISYKLQGTDTEIAAPTTGSGLAGVTKTFEAKGGADLYDGYQEGYFPVVKSHSPVSYTHLDVYKRQRRYCLHTASSSGTPSLSGGIA